MAAGRRVCARSELIVDVGGGFARQVHHTLPAASLPPPPPFPSTAACAVQTSPFSQSSRITSSCRAKNARGGRVGDVAGGDIWQRRSATPPFYSPTAAQKGRDCPHMVRPFTRRRGN
eukprot:354254-Chlamydomonas_euryale.AAC.9